MIRYRLVWLICALALLIGCGSGGDFPSKFEKTLTMVYTSAKSCIALSRANEATALEAVKGNPKFLLKPEMVNPDSRADLEEDWLKIETQMSSVSSPPEGYKDAKTSLDGLYDLYQKLYELATDPSGTPAQYGQVINVLGQVVDEKLAECRRFIPAK